MQDINKIVFEVYNGVLDMDYTKNEKKSVLNIISKIFRYLWTGYIFKLWNIKKKMNKKNNFVVCQDTYPGLKIAIYTVNTGNYDEIKDPIFVDENIDYYVFCNSEIKSKVWKRLEIPAYLDKYNSLEKARYLKTHPHLFFDNYDYSIFIDGNVRITCDIKPLIFTMVKKNKKIAIHQHQIRDCIYDEGKAILAAGKAKKKNVKKQLNKYKQEKFPTHFGLFETNIVIREHNNIECKLIMDTWWNEINHYTKRDQLSFTYALWKNGFDSEYVLSLGDNSRRNPYFIVDSHR